MYPILYEQDETAFKTQGLGALCDTTSCEVTEGLNGSFELELSCPASALHSEYLVPNNIILSRASFAQTRQAFRIYQTEVDINRKLTVYARHVSYDLSNYPINPSSLPKSVTGVTNALALLQTYGTGFEFKTDLTNTTSKITVNTPTSVRSLMGGTEGSIIDTFGGEWSYNNWTCTLNSVRGSGSKKAPVLEIKYGKNMKNYKRTKSADSLYSGILPFWSVTNSEDNTPTTIVGSIISTGYADMTRVGYLDCSTDFSEQPTVAQLNAKATAYIKANSLTQISDSVEVDFIQNSNERLELGDFVRIWHDGSYYTSRIIETTWDVLAERYSSLKVGSKSANIVDAIESVSNTTAGTQKEVYRKTITGLTTGPTNGSANLGLSASKYRVLAVTSSVSNMICLPGIYQDSWWIRVVNFTGATMALQLNESLGTVTIDYCNI